MRPTKTTSRLRLHSVRNNYVLKNYTEPPEVIMLHLLGWRQTHAHKVILHNVGHWEFFWAKQVIVIFTQSRSLWIFFIDTKTVNGIFITWTVKSTFSAYYLVSCLFVNGKLFLSYCYIVASLLNLTLCSILSLLTVTGSLWIVELLGCQLTTYTVLSISYGSFCHPPPPTSPRTVDVQEAK